ncbi:hypothetical protein PHYSODRAFT_328166 [Phytophthora sojae]|uniref:Uncharacterized protein n=1 Tax=Phytophthora sojae (strain P6497) TaxID=1094619 RepID=G4Z2G1_PHYSP|nr:hypothetical protein PHYSODRAFT_328166 [Phytophthora sojae]EGZ20002.1 hypothetical protein PHYSODRAFT_328166 [Phytophthora sojae]|eukprot:XP_009522719.1 hypothetical protein PHYSODRAFT_328166 [Phytophthora sojae]
MARIGSFPLLALTVVAVVSNASANVIDDTVDAVGDAYDSTASWVNGAADTVKDTAEDTYNTTSSWVRDAADTVGDTTKDAYDTVASATGSIVDDVSSAQTAALTATALLAAVGLAANIL